MAIKYRAKNAACMSVCIHPTFVAMKYFLKVTKVNPDPVVFCSTSPKIRLPKTREFNAVSVQTLA